MVCPDTSVNERLPKGHWCLSWIIVVFGFLIVIIFFEMNLRKSGWTPTILDSKELWSENRRKASRLGSKAFILVGASRIQLGMDLEMIRKKTSLEPVQLAIDGSSFMPVLENLSEDPAVTGTVLLSISMNNVKPYNSWDTASLWTNYYKSTIKNNKLDTPYKFIDFIFINALVANLVLRFEGAKPATVILTRAFQDSNSGNYLTMHSDRSRDADYTKVSMPDFYIERLKRNYGQNLITDKFELNADEILSVYDKAINDIKPLDKKDFIKGLEMMIKFINRIERHGGRVIIIRMPTTKLIREMDKKRYPRKQFWDEIEKRHKDTIYFTDYEELTKFELPDGSHLDVKDKPAFTSELLKLILVRH
jgi:hypothetical protein